MAKKAAPKAADAKAAGSPAAKSGGSGSKPASKSEIFSALSEQTKLSKKEIASVFDALGELIKKDLGKKGPGLFVIPGLLKLKIQKRPATKARPGINPFTKEPITIKAKPARNVVR